jgi:hypothetical protein
VGNNNLGFLKREKTLNLLLFFFSPPKKQKILVQSKLLAEQPPLKGPDWCVISQSEGIRNNFLLPLVGVA